MRDFHPLRMFTPKRTRDGFHTVPDLASLRAWAGPVLRGRGPKRSEWRTGLVRVRGVQRLAGPHALAGSGPRVEPLRYVFFPHLDPAMPWSPIRIWLANHQEKASEHVRPLQLGESIG